ncbi:hypothetical protein ACEPAH_2807 [Sanghuangporus vaninii]
MRDADVTSLIKNENRTFRYVRSRMTLTAEFGEVESNTAWIRSLAVHPIREEKQAEELPPDHVNQDRTMSE